MRTETGKMTDWLISVRVYRNGQHKTFLAQISTWGQLKYQVRNHFYDITDDVIEFRDNTQNVVNELQQPLSSYDNKELWLCRRGEPWIETGYEQCIRCGAKIKVHDCRKKSAQFPMMSCIFGSAN